MTAILYRAPAGVAGAVSRADEAVVESGFINPAKPPAAFGLAVKIVDGKICHLEQGDTADAIYGVLARVAPSESGALAQGFNEGVPNAEHAQSVLVKGYINVVALGTPKRGGKVYVRVNSITGQPNGTFHAQEDPALVEVPGWRWAVDGKDDNRIAEIFCG